MPANISEVLPTLPSLTAPGKWDGNRAAWKVARLVVLLITVAVIFGLVLRPEPALNLLWNLLIPVLPASFLIAPQLWRGVCPLGTLNQWPSGLLGRRQLAGRLLAAANAVGILLLVLMVPARRFAFNENGPVLAGTIVLVAVAALALGALFDGRGGFCNAICPVLPVERVYGQHPLVKLKNRRCDRCTLCIPKGCLDLEPALSLPQALGPEGRGHRWLATTHGLFAAALPGFIVGYNTTANGPWGSALDVYLWVALWSAGSYLTTTAVVWALGLSRLVALPVLAAVALGLYYWWAAPLIAAAVHLPAAGAEVGRAAAWVLAAFWLTQALRPLRLGRAG